MAKLSRSTIYGGLAIVVLAAVVYSQGGSDAVKPSIKAAGTKSATKAKDSEITQEDLDAKFSPPSGQIRNVFMPLVMRSGLRGGVEGGAPAGIPTELTMGEPNWVYTGMAEVNSVPQALIENTNSQDGVFLKQGEHWKQATVFQIKPELLTLIGADGVRYEIKVLGSQEPTAQTPAAGFKPLAVAPSPGLQGPIGGGNVQIQPTGGGNRTPGVTNVQNTN